MISTCKGAILSSKEVSSLRILFLEIIVRVEDDKLYSVLFHFYFLFLFSLFSMLGDLGVASSMTSQSHDVSHISHDTVTVM